MEKLSLNRFQKKYNHHINYGLSINSLDRLMNITRYRFDFDVYLPSKNINLQRPLVWTDLQKQQLIVSILRGIDIPKFIIIEQRYMDDSVEYRVIDGKQRLSTLFSFLDNRFSINVDGIYYFFSDLDADCQNKITGFTPKFDIHYSYYDDPISDDTKIDIFEQVNFLGTPQDVEHLNKLKNAK